MLTTCETYERLLEENALFDNVIEKKDQILNFWKKKKEDLPHKLKAIEKKLIDNGVDVEKIKKDAKSAAEKSKIKNGKSSNFQSSLNQFINDFKHKKYLTDVKEKIDDQPLPVKVILSIGILAIVVFINSFFASLILSITSNPSISLAITAVFVAPLVEETGKMISVKQNLTGPYFVIFNMAEFLLYVLPTVGTSQFVGAVISRIPPIFMHLFNTLIHVEAKKRNDPEGGLKAAVAIHTIWNTLASIPLLMR